jgi:hypothetical protein
VLLEGIFVYEHSFALFAVIVRDLSLGNNAVVFISEMLLQSTLRDEVSITIATAKFIYVAA